MQWNVIHSIWCYLCIGLLVSGVVVATTDHNALTTNASDNRYRDRTRLMGGRDVNLIAKIPNKVNRSDRVVSRVWPSTNRELFFGVLLPSFTNGHRRCVYEAVLPAMDLAIRKVQRPGGLLAGYNITIEHRDTRCSSTYGPLAAFELVSKRKPGSVRHC